MSDVTRININGVEYDSVEQMPPAVRAEYLQALAALRKGNAEVDPGAVTRNDLSHTFVQESFTYNGREYKSRDELPPEARTLFDQMGKWSSDAKTSEVEIKTVKQLPPEVRFIGEYGDGRQMAEGEAERAWGWVKLLGALVVILLFLILWLGLKRGG